MKIEKIAGKTVLKISSTEWDEMKVEAKKKSPKEHGFIDQCIKENSDKDNPGAYCASIVDKVKGSTDWRSGKKD